MLFGIELHEFFISLKKDVHLFIFRERGKEGEREGEKHQRVVASHAPPAWDLACNPGMCPDWELNPPPFGLQAGTQPTEPHQAGRLLHTFLILTPYQMYHWQISSSIQ